MPASLADLLYGLRVTADRDGVLEPRGIGWTGALGLTLLATAITTGFVLVEIGIHALRRGGDFRSIGQTVLADPVLFALAKLGGFTAAAAIGVHALWRADGTGEVDYREALALRATPGSIVALAITLGISLQLPLHEVTNLLGDVVPAFRVDEAAQYVSRAAIRIDSIRDAVLVPFVFIVVPAVSEELFFRGVLLPGLSRRYGRHVGLAASSILFGLIHVAPAAIVFATVAGFALGEVRRRAGSLLPSVAMHGAFNAVPVMLPASLVRIEGFNTIGSETQHVALPLVLGSALAAAAAMVALARLEMRDSDE